jgi:hypothetical protein
MKGCENAVDGDFAEPHSTMLRPLTTVFIGTLLSATILFLALGGLGLADGDLNAGTALRMDLEQLVEGSDLVLEARVLSETPLLGSDGLVYTDFELEVKRTFWGEDRPSRRIRLPGGALSTGRATLIPGMGTLRVGEEALLLLSSEGPQGARVFCGLSQGCYRILTPLSGSRVASREASADALLDETTGTLVPGMQAEVLEYADLMARCTAAVSAKHARHASGWSPGK